MTLRRWRRKKPSPYGKVGKRHSSSSLSGESIRLEDDDDCEREQLEARKSIARHLLQEGFITESATLGNAHWKKSSEDHAALVTEVRPPVVMGRRLSTLAIPDGKSSCRSRSASFTENLRLEEDEECIKEQDEARRLIRLHFLQVGLTADCAIAGNRHWRQTTKTNVTATQSVEPRRRRGSSLTNFFAKQLHAGLDSQTFSLSENLEQNDTRPGLDDKSVSDIVGFMLEQGCSFDDARLELTRKRMSEAGIDPDTGLPLDPKAVFPLDCCVRSSLEADAARSDNNIDNAEKLKSSPKTSATGKRASRRAAVARTLVEKLWGK